MTLKITSLSLTSSVLYGFLVFAAFVGRYSGRVYAITYRPVVLSGSPAPGVMNNETFNTFIGRPTINLAGDVAFVAGLNGNGVDGTNAHGIWSERNGVLRLAMRTGTQVPGASIGVRFVSNFGGPLLNDSGQIAFLGPLVGPGVNDMGIFSEGGGNLHLVARSGSPAPGSGGTFVGFGDCCFSYGAPAFNDLGQVAFVANLGGVSSSMNEAIWSEGGGSLHIVARKGSPAPGTESGVTFNGSTPPFDYTFADPRLNVAGQTAFLALLSGPGVDAANGVGIWSEAGGNLHLVARSGAPAPGTEIGVKYRDFLLDSLHFNAAGQMAFWGRLSGPGINDANQVGVWSEGGGGLHLVARTGSPAPGMEPGIPFAGLDPRLVLNGLGETAFVAVLDGPGVDGSNSESLWSEGGGILHLVARQGSVAPGTNGGHFFRFWNAPVHSLNSAGHMAFVAYLTDAPTYETGLWAEGQAGLELVARVGQTLEVAPGDFRVITYIDPVATSSNQEGRWSIWNDRDQLVFGAGFSDGSNGIFVASLSSIPEPASSSMLLFAVSIFYQSKRRGSAPGHMMR